MRTLEIQSTNPVCCGPIAAGPLSTEEAEQTAMLFRALSDPARVRLVSIIAAQPGQEACVCNLTEPVGLSQPTVSHHLKILTDAGLVTREQRGKWAYFRLQPEGLRTIAATLATTT